MYDVSDEKLQKFHDGIVKITMEFNDVTRKQATKVADDLVKSMTAPGGLFNRIDNEGEDNE